MLEKLKIENQVREPPKKKEKIHVMPYIHWLSHNVKKIAKKFEVSIFTSP